MERPDWFDESLFPFESKWMDVDGNTVHYIGEGEGPAIVMCHGNPTWSFLYRKVVSGLSDRFRCIAIDYPGFGLSLAAADYGQWPHDHSRILGEMVDRLELDEFSIMIQDWGGPIGVGMALQRKERLRSMIVCDTWAWPVTGDKAAERFSKILGGRFGQMLIKRANIFLNVIMRTSFRRKPKPTKAEFAMYKGPFPDAASLEPVAIMPAAVLGEEAWLGEIGAGLPDIADQPILLLWPTKDIAFKERHRQGWEHRFANHRTELIQGAGHYVQEEAGDELAIHIRKWWAETLESG